MLYTLEADVICYLNKQVKKSETTLVLPGEVIFMWYDNGNTNQNCKTPYTKKEKTCLLASY